ncbi:RlpA-like double-psi beta-barrel domain-containing protein [Sphingobium sp. HBC34]|uniref:Endolytic peptidoglycan transglycosylase RlpA n=2 Tax=Sphingobium cyanobacteriorum TaxID=3063954 RepID=A0ABT8ZMJ1_9SPHN|nr:RlpA-like double-psi beta-barrel domain-containing protein [Sphingobium sp. HBC34]MDO7835343.1 RlpA-like double-psi beta-barrel domain-containing protein [Sphingobium sp. HBC34]
MMLMAGSGGAVLAQPQPPAMVADGPVMLGEPFGVGGTTYTPADPLYYDEVGYAGEAREGSQGGATVTGEAFMPAAITAAHKTLPLPSYAEVTALDSGRTILVRVNDRGPMRNDQLIALSPGAMAQLGVAGQGAAAVRVRRVNPPEQERAVLRGHGQAAERLETPAALLKVLRGKLAPTGSVAVAKPTPPAVPAKAPVATQPRPMVARPSPPIASRPGAAFDTPAARPVVRPGPAISTPAISTPAISTPAMSAPKPVPAAAPARTGGYVVQVGAFSSAPRAQALARSLGARVEQAGGVWRVRLGPYPTQQAAQAGVRAAAAKGFENSRIMANDAR